MKGTRAILVLFLALASGLAAMVLGAQWMTSRVNETGTVVMVAGRDIALGTPIEPGMIEEVTWSSETLPTGAFTNRQQLDGRVTKTALLRGEPILEGRLAPVGTKGGLSSVIADGKRAITVRVNEVVGVAGFALPGNFVDVMVNAQDASRNPVSKIVLERILVLAVAQEASRDETKPKVVSAVTLEVSPEQAETLDLARSIGTLSLVLRNQIDQDPTETLGARTADLLELRQPPPPPQKPRVVVSARRQPQPVQAEQKPPQVEVIRGMQRSTTNL